MAFRKIYYNTLVFDALIPQSALETTTEAIVEHWKVEAVKQKRRQIVPKGFEYGGKKEDKALLDRVKDILETLQSNPEKYVFMPISDVDTTQYLASRMILLD